MPRVDAGGVALSAVTLGEGRRTVVMLHGLLVGSSASWYFTCAPALARTRRVVLYDLRGHGRSERVRDGYDVATMARDLGAVIDSPEVGGPVALVGHSYGALVALRFALDHPARVTRLALVEAPLPPSRSLGVETFLRRDPEEMLEVLPPAVRTMAAGGGRAARRFVESLRFLSTETSLLADLEAEPDIADAELARLAVPALCAYGDRSACRPVGERLARAIPGARLVVLPGGHFLHLDAPAALARALGEHLDG